MNKASLYLVHVPVRFYSGLPRWEKFEGEEYLSVRVVAFTEDSARRSAKAWAQHTAADRTPASITAFAGEALAATRITELDCIASSVVGG